MFTRKLQDVFFLLFHGNNCVRICHVYCLNKFLVRGSLYNLGAPQQLWYKSFYSCGAMDVIFQWWIIAHKWPIKICVRKPHCIEWRQAACVFVHHLHCLFVWICTIPTNGSGCLPSTPILPSPSLSAAFKNALVSLSVRSRPSLAKPFRTNLARDGKAE